MKKSINPHHKYKCIPCFYSTNSKKDFSKHVLTKKHKKSQNKDKIVTPVDFSCEKCGKTYKFRSGLSRHRNRCFVATVNIVENDNNDKKLSLKDNKKSPSYTETMTEIFKKQQKQMDETINLLKASVKNNETMIPKIGNNNNNTISINVFLNQECKNAMNLTDFIQELNVSLEDLDYSKNNGYVAGVTNIFTKHLKDMDPKDRPIHCSDAKRLQFYIKDDDKWEKDSSNEKIDKTIYNIKLKQTKKLSEWEKMHPNYQNDPELLNEWQMMLASMTEDMTSENPSKIKTALKRNIADHIQLKDAMIKNK